MSSKCQSCVHVVERCTRCKAGVTKSGRECPECQNGITEEYRVCNRKACFHYRSDWREIAGQHFEAKEAAA
jgi:hypothetical protein